MLDNITKYIAVLQGLDFAVLALQMNKDVVQGLIEGNKPVDPYQFMLFAGTYPVYITNGKGHYFSAIGKRGSKMVELVVAHKLDFKNGTYLIKGL